MVWYNPATWGRPRPAPTDEVLRCYGPECRSPINTVSVLYDREAKEIYGSDVCAENAIVHRTFRTGETQIVNLDVISLDRAFKLHREGKLAPLVK